jgi:hypothetical protein
MRAVAPAVGRQNVGEGVVKAFSLGLNAISKRCPKLDGVHQDAGDGACRDVEHIVNRPASVRVARVVAGQEPEALLIAYGRRRNAGIQAEKIGYWSTIGGPATWADRRLVLNQKQQVGAGIGGTGTPKELNTDANTGLKTKFANWASFLGSSMLKRSLWPVPMINSLISELPSRFTC